VIVSHCARLLGIATYCWPNGRIVLRLVGDLDATNAHRLFDVVVDLDLKPGQRVALNLEDVTSLDSVGASVLVACQRVARDHACSFSVTSPSTQVGAVLQMVGLDHLVEKRDQPGPLTTIRPMT
jgi:anti-anti-sigma factor